MMLIKFFTKEAQKKQGEIIMFGSLLLPLIAVSVPTLSITQIASLTEEVTLLWTEAETRFPGLTGIVDVTYSQAETNRFNTITGSDQVGFNYPCLEACAYLELAGDAYGKRGRNKRDSRNQSLYENM